MTIHPLSEDVIAQIAAGEVVERPASVVKELVENAIDAAAAIITVEIEAGGRQLIRVSDDGSGIRAEEVELAVQRHTTSKLQTADDLLTLQTLGFRGEALATIAAVSRMTLATRHRSQAYGSEVRLDGGRIRSRREVGQPAGTVITVENLFFNTPARLKFLKSEANERRTIQQLIQDYAIAYPQIRFVLISDGREMFRSTGYGQLEDVALKVFGLETFRQMIPISGTEPLDDRSFIQVSGYVSLPTIFRHDRSRMALFVNGRAVQDQNIQFAVTQAYHLLMERGRYPYAVVLLNVPPQFVDVNVHPTKAEVRFEDVNLVFVAVQRAVREALMRHTRLPTSAPPVSTASALPTTNLPHPSLLSDEFPLPTTDAERDSVDDDSFDYIPEGDGVPERPRTLPPLRVIGQLANAYIVAEGPAGLYLVDQFAASERVRYQQILDELQQGPLSSQPTSALTVDLTSQNAKALEKHLSTLAQFGFQLELFGTTTWRISAVPTWLAPQQIADVIAKFLLALENKGEPSDALIRLLAQAAAYKSGQRLERDTMEQLLRLLERCPSPLISPSGSATLIHMSRDQLTREFSRRT
jgi:DNA mismatch repair protein MutL